MNARPAVKTALAAGSLAVLAGIGAAVVHSQNHASRKAEAPTLRPLRAEIVAARSRDPAAVPSLDLVAVQSRSCPGLVAPRSWTLVWSDLQRGDQMHTELRDPAGAVLACDIGSRSRSRPALPPDVRELAAPSAHGAMLTLRAPAARLSALRPVFERIVRAQRQAMRGTPRRLSWSAARRASYYNVQVFQGKRRIVNAWPTHATLLIGAGTLQPGRLYTWYAWPAFGNGTAAHFGAPLARASLRG
jgi:hypothetical protein